MILFGVGGLGIQNQRAGRGVHAISVITLVPLPGSAFAAFLCSDMGIHCQSNRVKSQLY